MTGACGTDSTDGVSHGGEGTVMTPSMEKCLGLAAAPMFAIMALVTSVLGGGPMDLLCSGGQGGALSGMAPMYWLMSALHVAPWLKLEFGRRSAALRSRHIGHAGRSGGCWAGWRGG
jgi:hypothetical protein